MALKTLSFVLFVNLINFSFSFENTNNSLETISNQNLNLTSTQLNLLAQRIGDCSATLGFHEDKFKNCIDFNELLANKPTPPEQVGRTKPSQKEVWFLGLLFVTAISLCSLLGVSVLPLMQKAFYKQLLTALIGLAVGSLTSSSLFHLIPQALNLMERDKNHEYLQISLMLWTGIWVFFMIERIMKVINDEKRRQNKKKAMGNPSLGSPDSLISSDPNPIYDCQEQAIKASFGHEQKPKPCHGIDNVVRFQDSENTIASVAWMVIFGDGLHNFIDGLSIGAAFNESILTGISISVAVMCEEFPHELGDFAVLLNAGMTMKQALLYNFMSACTCYLGLVVGIILGEVEASIYIFGFAAGMFLYIALVDMVPEMNEVAEEASKKSVRSALTSLLLQNIGMGTGVLILYLLARYQDSFSLS